MSDEPETTPNAMAADPEVVAGESALLSRLHLIEEQPLDERAASLGQLHDELRAVLEAGDLSRGV